MNKSTSHAFINQLLVYTLVMICVSGSVGLGTVWLRQQMAQTANSIKLLQSRATEVERRLAETGTQIAAEQSPDVLERRNAEWRLGLVLPREQQVVRVNESVEQRLLAKRNSELFSGPALEMTPVRFIVGGAQ